MTVLIIGVVCIGLLVAYLYFPKDNQLAEADVLNESVVEEELVEEKVEAPAKKKELTARQKRIIAKNVAKREALKEAGDRPFHSQVVPILERYCVECHDEVQQEGDLNLELYLEEKYADQQPELWENLAKVVSLEQMPPSDRKDRPTEEEVETVLNWVESLIAKWDAGEMGQDPGKTTIHRLNKYEYNYTVRDLFGLKEWLVDGFPEDGTADSGFTNNADALYLPTLLVENYFESAETIVEKVYSDRNLRSRYLISRPAEGVSSVDAAKKVLKYWSAYIYRKPIDQKEFDRLVSVFIGQIEKGKSYDEAMQMPLFTMLISPNFLYRSSLSEQQAGVYAIDDFELASRLSYFLWSSMPDKELFRLAQIGKLSEDEVLVAQVKRMLKDDKAGSLGKHLGGQWFGWEDLRAVANPDETKFPEFDFNLRVALYQESTLYFNHLIKNNGSIYDLLDSDYTFLNSRLARFYKLPAVSGDQLQLVKLTDRNRGGVLGMGSVLTSTSLALRSSPSIRGAYVLRDLLGVPLPEPPMNVEPLPDDDKDLKALTARESLVEHRTNPSCRSCHAEIDSIGFGLEAFDAIGRIRTHQNGVKLDISGTMPDGTEFSSPAGLKTALLKNKEQFATNTARKFLTYALGRELMAYDRPVVKQISDAIIDNNGSIETALIEVVMSYPFKHRRGDSYKPTRSK